MGEGPEGVRCKRCGASEVRKIPSGFSVHDGNKDWYHEEYLEIRGEEQKQIDKEQAEIKAGTKQWERDRKEKKRAEQVKRVYTARE